MTGLTVGRKIFLGFLCLISLLGFVAFIGYGALEEANQGFTDWPATPT